MQNYSVVYCMTHSLIQMNIAAIGGIFKRLRLCFVLISYIKLNQTESGV